MIISERTKNTIVGMTVLVGLVILVAGMIFLDKMPSFRQVSPYTIVLQSTNAAGLTSGNKVDFNGVIIGSVSDVSLAPDMVQVQIALSINSNVDVPSNAVASVGKQTIGTPYVSLTLPQGQTPQAPLPRDGTGKLMATAADSGLIPKSVIDSFTRVGDSVEELLRKKPLSEFEKEDPDSRIANISVLVQRLDRVARGVDVVIGNPQQQQELRNIIRNIEQSSAQLHETLKTVDTVVHQASDTVGEFRAAAYHVSGAATQASSTLRTTEDQIQLLAGKMAVILKNLESTTNSLNKNQGTAGKLINDPRLYDTLVDLSASLKNTSDDLNLLLRKWKEEGVKLNLK